MVLLDVVYNHFGPEGNYLHAYAPQFFTERHQTPWGAAINFDGDATRARCATSSSTTRSTGSRSTTSTACASTPCTRSSTTRSRTSSTSSRAAVRDGPGPRPPRPPRARERRATTPRYLERDATRRAALLRRAVERRRAPRAARAAHRRDATATTPTTPTRRCAHFGRALAEGFAYQGEPSPFATARRAASRAPHLPPAAFVDFLQNHDQVGNRAFGERLAGIADPAALRAVTACVLLAPASPMLFMGEEFAASSPFLYFCDFDGELAQAVARGRREEFARFSRFADPAARARIPDPNATQTFERSKLDWREREQRGPRRVAGAVPEPAATAARAVVPAPVACEERYVRGDCARATVRSLAAGRAWPPPSAGESGRCAGGGTGTAPRGGRLRRVIRLQRSWRRGRCG